MPYKRQKTAIVGASKSTRWSNGEISTLIFGIMRLGEKEFTDLMGQTIFMKREHDLKVAYAGGDLKMVSAPQMPDKSKHSTQEIAQKWSTLKLMRDLDVDRLNKR